jgi:hypothetical protein
MKYILKNKIELFKMIISSNRIDYLYKLIEFSSKIALEILDKMIEMSVNQNNAEITSILVEYKNKHSSSTKSKK